MTTFHEQYSDEESDLVRGFSITSSSTTEECHCGRMYFVTASTGGDFEPGELERLIECEKNDPDKFISSPEFDTIDSVLIDGRSYIPQCKCGGVRKYLYFLNDHFEQITRFCINRLSRERKEDERKLQETRRNLEGFKTKKLPIGTRIRFVKDLYEPANEDHPPLMFAVKDQTGVVQGYCGHEGHFVETRSGIKFGASYGTEFVEDVDEPVVSSS